MKTTLMIALATAAALITISPATLAQSGGNYSLNWNTIAGGGGTCAGGNYSLHGSVGQPFAGLAGGGSYTLVSGFWAGAITRPQPERPRLEITAAGTGAIISWPVSATGFRLQETSDLIHRNWSFVATPPLVFGDENVVVMPTTTLFRFYRLVKP